MLRHIVDNGRRSEGEEILREIEAIKEKLEVAKINFNTVTDFELIDSYIYEMISLNSKYQYYIKRAKSVGLTAEGFDDITVTA